MSRHMQLELDKIRHDVTGLVSHVENIVVMAVRALVERDKDMALKIVNADTYVNEKEVDIEESCLKVLALHQPVAMDLRYLIGVIKLNNDIERIADLAVNIAERALYLIKAEEVAMPFDLPTMSKETCTMLRNTIKALFERDKDLARAVIKRDQVIDDMNRDMYDIIFKAIKNDPQRVDIFINYLSAGRHLERIADYCTNIAEDLIYMEEGIIVRHHPEIS
ncbi:MAG: phosphate transport system regulatory protein PhoU [Bdellovibrionales bacterium GWA2_49_15]|nr:MAG: phosphate transport system regulatory protein PhoU [Bdellovibrionales bacterium GWA2_49_15]